jgi:hypothetical protein
VKITALAFFLCLPFSAWLEDSRALKPRGFFWVGLNTAQDLNSLYARVDGGFGMIGVAMREQKPLCGRRL